MADKTFLQVYGATAPAIPTFARCDHCEDMNTHGIVILGTASAISDSIVEALAELQVPPEALGFVMNIIASATLLGMAERRREERKSVVSVLSSYTEFMRSMKTHIDPEIARVQMFDDGESKC